jgi:UDP-3-O-[3-hydroxymyristoyl] glucosamine N-acyltransferase
MKLAEIAQSIDATLKAPSPDAAGIDIAKIAEIDKAVRGDLTFLSNENYKKYLTETKASAIIVKAFDADVAIPQLVHPNPYVAFAKASQLLQKKKDLMKGLSDKAFVSPTAKLGKNVSIYPFAFIGANVVLGDDVVIFPNVYIGDNAVIGAFTTVHANCSIMDGSIIGKRCTFHAGTVIGADGFGFASDGPEVVKVPQIGIVRIGDDVELGALCTIDRATIGETVIGNKTKFDDRVHIAHNVEIGERCLFAAFVGISGSTKIGNDVMMGGHSGATGHLRICDQVAIGAMSGVTKNIDKPGMYVGFPAAPAKEWRKRQAMVNRLETQDSKLKALQARLAQLEAQIRT